MLPKGHQRGLEAIRKYLEILGKKRGVVLPKIGFACCNKPVKTGEVWFLKDFKGYIKRKLYIGKCSICGDDVVLQIMTSTNNNKTYYNLYNGIEAVKVLYREKKRKVQTMPDIKADCFFGWVYGINKEIKNKKGEVTQIRQYASSFNNQKKLVKKIFPKIAKSEAD